MGSLLGIVSVGVLVLAGFWIVGRLLRRWRPSRASYARARAVYEQLQAMPPARDALPLRQLLDDPVRAVGEGTRAVFDGRLRSGRRVKVTPQTGTHYGIGTTYAPLLELEVAGPTLFVRRRRWPDRLFRWSLPRAGLDFSEFIVVTPDRAQAKLAFKANASLARDLDSAFNKYALESISCVRGTQLTARGTARTRPADLPALLERLDRIAASFEPVAVTVKVLGGARRALTGLHGSPRCSYCHADVTGDEPDLVACGLCGTILHDGCWSELGRCPVLGCTGREPERPERPSSGGDPERASPTRA